jgi:hypothetical protein
VWILKYKLENSGADSQKTEENEELVTAGR